MNMKYFYKESMVNQLICLRKVLAPDQRQDHFVPALDSRFAGPVFIIY